MLFLKLACTCSVIIIQTQIREAVDPCANHDVIKDEVWRSAGIVTNGSASCDRRLTKAWYRIDSKAGTDMPTECPELNRCGTVYPVWLNDTLPSNDGKEYSKKASLRYGDSCSAVQVDIKVKNCGDFRVWYLSPLGFCSAAYCFGTLSPCKNGESSESGYSPCEVFPENNQTPLLDWELGTDPQDSSSAVGIIFTCSLPNPNEVKQGFVIDVEWYSEMQGKTKTKIDTYEGTELTASKDGEVRLYEHNYYTVFDAISEKPTILGGKIYCSIRLRRNTGGVPSIYRYSTGLFIGVKVLTEKLTVKEAGNKTIKVTPTIPLLSGTVHFGLVVPKYPYQNTYSCTPEAQQMLTLKKTHCSIAIDKFTYNEISWRKDWEEYKKKTFEIPIEGKVDGTYGDSVMSVSFKAAEIALGHPIWSHVKLPDVQVTLTDLDIQLKSKLCYSRNDPHMKTFDGKKYENHNVGEFVLYKHRTIPVQVNAFYDKCNRIATCNCAVAVRAGKDVFILDHCKNNTGPVKNYNTRTPWRIGVIGCDRKGMNVVRKGKTYTVTLPTGTQVIIELGGWGGYPNIGIKPSIVDIGQTEGLCGTLNSNATDDFVRRNKTTAEPVADPRYPNEFSNSWKVTNPKDSLYDGVQSDESYSWSVYCTCSPTPNQTENGAVNCTYNNVADECLQNGKPLSKNAYQKCDSFTYDPADPLRKRRSVAEDKNTLVFKYDKHFVPQKAEWTKEWNEEKAGNHCNHYIRESSIGKSCSGKDLGVDIDGAIANCIEDIKISGGTEWQSVSLNGVKNQCIIEIKKNTSLWIQDPSTESLTLPSDMLDMLCPENCSGRGNCINEECHCEDGYGDEDCGTDLSLAPTNVFIQTDESACKKNKDPCDSMPVYGDNIAESQDLLCKLRHCQITEMGMDCNRVVTVGAEYENIEKVNCPIPTNNRIKRSANDVKILGDAYYISVSNDGGNFSTEVSAVIFDSKCIECNTTTLSCVQKDGTCFIENVCYSPDETQGNQTCFMCSPWVSMTSWSRKETECFIENKCYLNATVKSDERCKLCVTAASKTEWTVIEGCITNSSSWAINKGSSSSSPSAQHAYGSTSDSTLSSSESYVTSHANADATEKFNTETKLQSTMMTTKPLTVASTMVDGAEETPSIPEQAWFYPVVGSTAAVVVLLIAVGVSAYAWSRYSEKHPKTKVKDFEDRRPRSTISRGAYVSPIAIDFENDRPNG